MNKIHDLFLNYEESIVLEETQNQQAQKEVQQFIKNSFENNRKLCYKIKNNPGIMLDKKYIDMLISSGDFQTISYCDLTLNTYLPKDEHILNYPFKEGGLKVAGATPFLQVEDIRMSWNSITEVSNLKTASILVSSAITLLFGDITEILQGVYMFAIFHFIAKLLFSPFEYVIIWQNLKLLFMIFFWIALAHAVAFWGIVSKSAAEMLFNACLVGIGFAEIKGTIECCEKAGYFVPKEIKDLAKLKNPFKNN